METLRQRAERVHPGTKIDHLDKVQIRTRHPWSNKAMQQMRTHAKDAFYDFKAPRFENGKPKIKEPWLLTLICPNAELLRLLGDKRVVYVEFARDYIQCEQPDAETLRDYYDEHFVQRWHRGNHQHFEDGGSYTKFDLKAGLWFLWYHRISKIANVPSFHIEAKVRGAKALNRVGVHLAIDLIGFDHAAFWERNLLFYEVDFEKFGRWHESRRLGHQRRTPRPSDRRIGTTLYRINGETSEFTKFAQQFAGGHGKQRWVVDGDAPDKRITHRSVQRIVDLYGLNASFLRRLDPINCDKSREHSDVPINSVYSEGDAPDHSRRSTGSLVSKLDGTEKCANARKFPQ